MQLVKEHKDLETILENLDKKKYPVAEDWPYKEARALFMQPEVTPGKDLEV